MNADYSTTAITDDLYNNLTNLKPSQRVEYLQLNGYNNIDEILRNYSDHKNSIRADAIKERKTKTQRGKTNNKIIDDAMEFIKTANTNSVIIPFKTDDDPPPSFDFKVWSESDNEIIPITLLTNQEPEPEPDPEPEPKTKSKTKPDTNPYDYLINLNGDCYNIFINSYVVIEIDKTTKTIKIIDDIEGRNKEILNINI
jgi:hypothetical protein